MHESRDGQGIGVGLGLGGAMPGCSCCSSPLHLEWMRHASRAPVAPMAPAIHQALGPGNCGPVGSKNSRYHVRTFLTAHPTKDVDKPLLDGFLRKTSRIQYACHLGQGGIPGSPTAPTHVRTGSRLVLGNTILDRL